VEKEIGRNIVLPYEIQKQGFQEGTHAMELKIPRSLMARYLAIIEP
jgi:hypothetical protein